MTRTHEGPVALLGAGTISGGWAAAYLARSWPVIVADPAADVRERLLGFLEASWPSVWESAPGAPPQVPAHLIEFAALGIDEWWADLGQPRLTEEVKSVLINAAEQVLAGRPLPQVRTERDKAVVTTMPRLHGDMAAPGASGAEADTHVTRQDASA